jgi:acyl-CoA thioester hydrolase
MTRILDKAAITELGIEGGWVIGLRDFVRYGDLDTLNHVNNKVYHAWFENLRVLYITALGVTFEEEAPIKPVVRTANIAFNAPMFLDEDYITLCRVSKLGRTSFTIDYAVWVDGVFRVTGDTVMVMLNADATATTAVPDELRKIMIERDGAKTA